jgi:hypothetical protein
MAFNLVVPRRGLTASVSPHTACLTIDLKALGLDNLPDDTEVFSFQRLPGREPIYLPFDAGTRLELAKGKSHVATIGVQSVSAYSDLILWDLAHAIPVGGTLTLLEPVDFADCVLWRAYFHDAFEIQRDRTQGWSKTVLKKMVPLRSEADAGVGAWTFGLPVGSPSQTVIDRLAKQIDSLGLDRWELIFAVSDAVPDGSLTLPEHVHLLHCPRATITEKKNRIAEVARHGNLCIFHDRVELPRNFKNAVSRFGDHYAICGFQHLLFDSARDSLERYSDYHVDLGDGNPLLEVDGAQKTSSLYIHSLETRLRFRANFAEAHPADYDRRNYLTGTLYLVKRSIWQLIGQHPEIEWNELEDTEFGARAIHEFGVPSRVNPHAFGFTSRVRAVLVGTHDVADRRGNGSVIRIKSDYRSGPMSSRGTGMEALVMRQRAWQLFQEFGLPAHDFDMRTHIFTAFATTTALRRLLGSLALSGPLAASRQQGQAISRNVLERCLWFLVRSRNTECAYEQYLFGRFLH